MTAEQDQKLLQQIQNGKAKMLPKAFFTAKSAATFLEWALLGGLAIFFVSFAIFYIRSSGYAMLPAFGYWGNRALMAYFPWLTSGLALILLILLAYLVFQKNFASQKPALYTLLAILLIVISASFALANTPLHQGLQNSAQKGRLPLMGRMYSGTGFVRGHNLFIGTVKNLRTGQFELVQEDNTAWNVLFNNNTRWPHGNIQEGQVVAVMGALRNDNIEAWGINPYALAGTGFPRGGMRMRWQMMGQ